MTIEKKGLRLINQFNTSEKAKDILRTQKVYLRLTPNKGRIEDKYNKKDYFVVYKGYDAFENFMLVRTYIQKKYDIPINTLEILLFLFPKQYFTQEDYGSISKQYTIRNIKSLLESGLITISAKGAGYYTHLYTLSNKGKRIVFSFYEMLSGEIPIPIDKVRNKMAGPESNASDKKKMEMIKKLQNISKDTK
ncbi:hypothetical protein [Flavobacterium psychrophilum]|uniref:Uncharacterized protein n=1 Tax=Flavobacterium psychrophilum TaxID=96345 RepID=A0A7U2R910_FLAPS|nr:hypothetical protein [Flavobacterium psychrophilum]QRE03498.1 hypothetical protein H0H26_11495 [Flavobacterium psychrophilum]